MPQKAGSTGPALCDNPNCRKVIPEINLEFGGPHIIVNFMEGLEWDDHVWYACGPACRDAARAAYERSGSTREPCQCRCL